MDNSKYGYIKAGIAEQRDGFARQHQAIAAKALGRRLKYGEEVHHADGNGANNDGNLVICTRAYHKYLHFLERVRSLDTSRAQLIQWHHTDGLPLEEIKRRLNLGEGMIGRWFKRMNIPIVRGVGGRGSKLWKSKQSNARIAPCPNRIGG
jgi:hypothetical protein